MAATIVLDAETHADATGLTKADLQTLRDAADKREQPVEQYIATCPALARVALVGMLNPDTGGRVVCYDSDLLDAPVLDGVTCNAGRGEALLLTIIHGLLPNVTQLVTYNGRGFDVPLLLLRSMRHRLTPAPILTACAWQKPWESRPGIDVMHLLSFGGATGRYGLASMALGLGVANPKQGGDGGDVAALIAARNGTDLARYCLGDVASTCALAVRAGALAPAEWRAA